MSNLLEIAKSAAKLAGDFLAIEKRDAVESLDGKDIKLYADKESEKIIINYLKSKSEYPILTEETGEIGDVSQEDGFYWIIDPIDGTFNYFRGMKLCCVSIALYKSGQPILGVINQFLDNKLYYGEVGVGSWCNDEPIFVSKIKQLSQAALATGFPVYRDFSDEAIKESLLYISKFKKIRMLGTAALSITKVASAHVDAYIEEDIMLWDVAAGCAILLGAGGCVVMEQSEKYKWGRKVMCFASEELKEELLDEISGN